MCQCSGATLSCGGGATSCGSWDFETGTEGWAVDPGHALGWDGRISSTTQRAALGSHSLLVGAKGSDYLDISVSLCGSGQAAMVSSFQKLSASMYLEPSPGQPIPDPDTQTSVAMHWYFGTDSQSYVESEVNRLTAGVWLPITGTIGGSFQGMLKVNIQVYIALPNWTGTLYLDNVRFE
jgi:hypothetical protein